MEKKFYWRKLDDQAKVFALASNNKYCSVFRLSVMMKEKIEPDVLQEAVDKALEVFKAFKVKMKVGLYWYYFVANEKKPVISVENEYPFKKVNTRQNNDYLFRVTYFENKINVEFFHALTDGNNALSFLKEIIYNYIEIKYPNDIEKRDSSEIHIITETENAYRKSYRKLKNKIEKHKTSYMIKGKELWGEVGITHLNLSFKDFRAAAKKEDCSVTAHIAALFVYSVYDVNYKLYDGKRPINIHVPIDLKRFIETETVSNFFSYIMISIKFGKNKMYTFYDVLQKVKQEFERNLNKEKLIDQITKDAGMTHNFFIRILPLFIKKWGVRLGSLNRKRTTTATISNLGGIELHESYSKYVDEFAAILSPDWAERIKCGICSYKDRLNITFGTKIKDISIEKRFKELLEERGVQVEMEGNGVNGLS